jgi:hypothetical protein
MIETLSPVGDRNNLECFRCTRLACDRHYHRHFGYFSAPPGQPLDLGDADVKPCCRRHELQLFKYVQRTKTGWQYACPDPRCASTSPFAN